MPRQKYQNEGLIPRLFALVRHTNEGHKLGLLSSDKASYRRSERDRKGRYFLIIESVHDKRVTNNKFHVHQSQAQIEIHLMLT